MKKFKKLYSHLINEADEHNTVFDYDAHLLLIESPDDYYGAANSYAFLTCDDFYAVGVDEHATHGDLFFQLEAFVVNGDKLDTNIIDDDIIEIPKRLKDFLYKTYNGGIKLTRDSYLNEIHSGLLGRISTQDRVISFWNIEEDFNKENVKIVKQIVTYLGEGVADEYMYDIEGMDGQIPYDEFAELSSTTLNVQRPKSDHIVHTLDPSIKGQVMKMQGVKPKKPLGAEMRYAMGESFEKLYKSLLSEAEENNS